MLTLLRCTPAGYAAQSILAAIGCIQFISNVVFAWLVCQEKVSQSAAGLRHRMQVLCGAVSSASMRVRGQLLVWACSASMQVGGKVLVRVPANMRLQGMTRQHLVRPQKGKPQCLPVRQACHESYHSLPSSSQLQPSCRVCCVLQATRHILTATALVVAGCVLLVVFGNHGSEELTVQQLLDLYNNRAYIAYLAIGGATVGVSYVLYWLGSRAIT